MTDESDLTDKNSKECAKGCDCSTPGMSTKVKIIICLLVGIAAAAALAHGIMNKDESGCDPSSGSSCCP